MSYIVQYFAAKVSNTGGHLDAANQLQELINSKHNEGWNFVSVENISSVVAGSGGCFGIGGTPPQLTSYQMVIFKK